MVAPPTARSNGLLLVYGKLPSDQTLMITIGFSMRSYAADAIIMNFNEILVEDVDRTACYIYVYRRLICA